MLSKCTNLSCSASFRHLADGRLFQLENDSPVTASKATEYFWLCHRCSAAMTLRLAHDGNVAATELPESHSTQWMGRIGESSAVSVSSAPLIREAHRIPNRASA